MSRCKIPAGDSADRHRQRNIAARIALEQDFTAAEAAAEAAARGVEEGGKGKLDDTAVVVFPAEVQQQTTAWAMSAARQ